VYLAAVTVPVGTPVNAGVVRDGLVANTAEPVPVSSVRAVLKFAELGVAKKVATPEPSPDTPVETGKPVQLVKVPEVGVPKRGVVKDGLVFKTLLPEPVELVTPVPPLATGSVPVTPDVRGKPVTLVIVPDAGVPRAGATSIGVVMVGVVEKTATPVPVSSVSAAARLAELGVPRKVATLLPRPDIPEATGSPEQLVKVPDCGVPNTGIVIIGAVKVLFVSVADAEFLAASLVLSTLLRPT
jgi:hypothetical protein